MADHERRQGLKLDPAQCGPGIVGGVYAESLADRAFVDRPSNRGIATGEIVQLLPRLAPETLDLGESVELQVDRQYLSQRACATPVSVKERSGVIAYRGTQGRICQILRSILCRY